MNLFPSPSELYSHSFPWEIFSISRNILYPGIKFSKLVTSIGIYIAIILFSGINKYNLKQTRVHNPDIVVHSLIRVVPSEASFHINFTYFIMY